MFNIQVTGMPLSHVLLTVFAVIGQIAQVLCYIAVLIAAIIYIKKNVKKDK